MSAVSSTYVMANTSAGTHSDSFASAAVANKSQSVHAVDATNMNTNSKSHALLTAPNSHISGNLSSNSSVNSTTKSGGSKTNDATSSTAKRKPLSNSRQKKFHRHFPQVPADEEVINCKWHRNSIFHLTV